MSDKLMLGAQQLMEPKRLLAGMDDLLHKCVRSRSTLSLQLLPDQVVVGVGPNQTVGLTLSGRWRSPALNGNPEGARALLLLPFVFQVEALHLRHDQIYSLGRGDRTLADFFMRNVFHAACRGAPFAAEALPGNADPAVAKSAHDLRRTYRWISKALMKNPLLENADFAELILAAAHVPLPGLGSPLMQASAAALRRCTATLETRLVAERPLAQLMQLRAKVLKLYA